MRTKTRFYGIGLLVLVVLGLAVGFSGASELSQIDPTAQQQTVEALVQQRLQQMAATQTVEAAVYQALTATAAIEATLQTEFDQALAATAAIEATVNAQIAGALAATLQAERLAGGLVNANVQWAPVVQEVGGVPMVQVPAGCFMMGSSDGYSDEQPVHEQCFEQAFWIGQTEVTNAQYAAFMDAGGYTNATYWTEAGWSWRQSENRTQPDCWTNSAFNQLDQPVVCVTWYEAVAYSAWLSATSGETFRLPTEAEWEYAARGPDGLIYPWGNEWNADNAVTGETSRGLAAVGSRPAGASWVGALDMSGNVWEWLSSQYAAYPYSATDGREDVQADARRVVRGGSWDIYQDFARASVRGNFSPRGRSRLNLGFRVSRPLQNH